MKKTIIVSLTTLFLASLIFVLTVSGKPEKKEPIPKPKTKMVFVCNSASNCKIVMDAYFKNGFELESVTTQITQINNFDGHNLNSYGGNINREYLLVLTK